LIGVIAKANQIPVVEEFFELFKTPWEFCQPGRYYQVVVATADEMPDLRPRLMIQYGSAQSRADVTNGIAVDSVHPGGIIAWQDWEVPIYAGLVTFDRNERGTGYISADVGMAGFHLALDHSVILRIGYDVFEEVRFLLSIGQPVERAHIPTLDQHIVMLRDWILNAGIPIVEIPPTPAGHDFAVCLTHDIDFVGIRRHAFDHTMWGFVYRSTLGGVGDLVRRKIGLARLLRMWRAAAFLPFVLLGWARDFWEPFGWYLETERGLPATYFLIPFKRRSGEKVSGAHPAWRATAYDVTDIQEWTSVLIERGCEIGVHGIDAWHDASRGREELAKIAAATKDTIVGIRMHWLLQDSMTPSVLEDAAYTYDASVGYNETVGYRCGTSQVFRPLGSKTMLELPLHIQDGALFFSNRLDLSEPEAERLCNSLIANTKSRGGVLTVLWHDRSHGPERFWGDFYVRLVRSLKSQSPWFATASQIVQWFRQRREVRFNPSGARMSECYAGNMIEPPLRIRLHFAPLGDHREPPAARAHIDIDWNGRTTLDLDSLLKGVSERTSGLPHTELCSLS
jgi:hypothetical protein